MIPENLKEKMKELGQTIAPSAHGGGGGASGSGGPEEKPELVPLRALQKAPPANPEGTPEMVRSERHTLRPSTLSCLKFITLNPSTLRPAPYTLRLTCLALNPTSYTPTPQNPS